VDLATLTGACVVALGKEVSGLMGNNDQWIAEVKDAADRAGLVHRVAEDRRQGGGMRARLLARLARLIDRFVPFLDPEVGEQPDEGRHRQPAAIVPGVEPVHRDDQVPQPGRTGPALVGGTRRDRIVRFRYGRHPVTISRRLAPAVDR